ncbi:MAG: SCO family protein [Chthoniobacterales bacterium]
MSIAICALVAVLLTGACSRTDSGDESKGTVYPVRGVVRELRVADAQVVIEHETIPNYMPGMTMPFNIRDKALFDKLEKGKAYSFDLVVEGDSSWIENVKEVDASTLDLPKKAAVKPSRSDRLRAGDALPDFKMQDQLARPVSPETFAGKDLLLTFIFTRCAVPDFCPRISGNFAEIEKAILADADLSDQVKLLSISIDPEFDTPAVLKEYAETFSKGGADMWYFATGDEEQANALKRAFSVYAESANGTIDHGLATAWIAPNGEIKQIWRGNFWKPEEVLEAIKSEQSPPKQDPRG